MIAAVLGGFAAGKTIFKWTLGIITFSSLLTLAHAEEQSSFEAARQVLETRCLSCHNEEKHKSDFRLDTRENLMRGGESKQTTAVPGKPEESWLIQSLHLPEGDDERMPPKKQGNLKPEQIASLEKWVRDGLPWPQGVKLVAKKETALPAWDAAPDPRIKKIEAFPAKVSLETASDFHRPIVILRMEDGTTHDITQQSRWTLADPTIAKLNGNLLTPLKDGSTTLRIDYRSLSCEIPVTVSGAAAPRPVSYQLDVMPVLTAAGCNAGSCHGSARGKDGFHLSLYGFDPKGDHFRLTGEIFGRRINRAVPEDSLLITKAIGTVPHTGGKLIEKDSPFYQTLVTWIRNGATYDETPPAKPTGIEVQPKEVLLQGPDIDIPYTVRATYSDGTDRDVSTLSSFSSSNDNSVAIAMRKGLATSKNRGEAFVMARFHIFTEGAQAIVIPEKLDYQKPTLPEANYVDGLVYAKLDKLRIIPSDVCSDEEFVRRVFLDIIGRLPKVEERNSFLASQDAKKRAALIDDLISRKEFTEMWVMKWAELLQIRTVNDGGGQVSYKAALGYYNWLRERIAGKMPFDQLVRELLSAKGGTFVNPATNMFQIEQDTLKLTENVAQVFMGTRIQCAQCHNHPFDRWTMEDYYGFASFFAQVKRKPAEDPRERIIFDGDGEIPHPVTKQNAKPKYLGGDEPKLERQTRREAVAEWLTAKENPWFASNVANIVWAHFLGCGIVEPVDDVRISNPPSNPQLLDALAKRFVESNHDVRQLVRDICNSRTYQFASRTNETNVTDERNFSHALIRRIRAEVLLDSISLATSTPNKFKGLPLGANAVQIADGNTTNYFLTTFGRATRATVCSCEVKMEPNLSQALHMLNGDTTHKRIRDGKVVEKLLESKQTPESIIRDLYLRTVGREPTATEQTHLMEAVSQAKDPKEKQQTLEDIFWALLNSKEFLFNH